MSVSKVVFKDGTVLMDISDSTVTAKTLKNGVIAYGADGERIKGTMPIYDYTPIDADHQPENDSLTDFVFMGSVSSDKVFEDEAYLKVPKEDFGEARASDVAKGKTFTSCYGFCIEGTHEEGHPVILPTRTVTVTDNDWAGDVVVTALVNEGGKLIYKSMNVSSGDSVTFTYAWYTPIFIKSRWVSSIAVYDAEGDLIRNSRQTCDAANMTYAVFPQSDGGDNHTVIAFQ